MDKKDLWPKEGKLKKVLIILGVVIAGALTIVLIEEKTGMKLSRRVTFLIAFACVGIWVYKPKRNAEENKKEL